VETEKGAAQEVYDYYNRALSEHMEQAGTGDLSAGSVLRQVLTGHFFGLGPFLSRAAKAFRKVKDERPIPTVLVVGEIYVRCDPFSNDYIIRKLEAHGIRGRFAPLSEWLEYTDYYDVRKDNFSDLASSFLQATIQNQTYNVVGEVLGWPRRTTVQDSLQASAPYMREHLAGEAVLTIGGPVAEWREGHIDGVVSVGPLECMPNKIAEAQFFHVAEQEGLISLTLSLNGDPVDPEIIDNFAYEIKEQFARRRNGQSKPPAPAEPRRPSWVPQTRVNPDV
jgi:hypothetical protein